MSNWIKEFLEEYLLREPYADEELLVSVLSEMENLIRNNKDKTKEEIIELIINKHLESFERIRKMYGVPGYTTSINVGNVKVKLYGGNINYLGEPMPENALFDIASMTKFYTQIIAYKLMQEGLFKRDDRIIDLDPRFFNLGDLTVDDILTFGTTFRTNGLIKDKKTIEEAKDTLYSVQVTEKGKWNYNDIDLMIMKEVMERLTGKKFEQLVNEYIIKPYHLTDTHLIVPNSKFHLITGTPNFKTGNINDMSANALGGFSGHAGIFASSDDLTKMLMESRNETFIHDAYTPGKLNAAIGIMGNVYTSNRNGLRDSFVDSVEPRDSFAIAGSTRTNAGSSSDSTYNVLFNPSSMNVEEAKERIAKINEERMKKDLIPLNPVREYEFTRDGRIVRRQLIDPRQLLPLGEMEEIIKKTAYIMLQLRFLNYLMKDEKVEIVRNTK